MSPFCPFATYISIREKFAVFSIIMYGGVFMKPKLSLKTLFRSPVKTVLTFLLILAVTFSLFSQVLEYSVAKREMEKAVAEYKGVGSVFSG